MPATPALTNAAFINADGSVNIAAIMTVAHRRARHERNITLCTFGYAKLPRMLVGEAEATYARLAASVDGRTLDLPARFTYAAEFKRALAQCWFEAGVLRRRALEAIVRARKARPVPMFRETAQAERVFA